MLRTCLSFMGTSSVIESKTPSSNQYRLYLLPDDSEASLKTVQRSVNGGNAVLLYPDLTDKSKYKACFIQKGNLRTHPFSKKLEEVPMGNRAIHPRNALPCDITTLQPNGNNLIKTALGRAGIQLESILSQIPDVLIREEILPIANNLSLAALARTSFYNYKLTQPELHQRAIKKLFTHIINGEPDEIKKMLNVNPRLSLVRWKPKSEQEKIIRNKAGQCINVQGKTVYQLALGEEDTEIAAILKAAIVKVSDEKEADVQYNAQFTEGWEEVEKERWTLIFIQLNTLAETIRDAKPGDITSSGESEHITVTVREKSEVARALAQFRSMLDATLNEIVKTGRHFNPNLLQRALQIYVDHFDDYFGNDCSDPRAMLFLQQAIGYIERQLPANYAQAVCAGLYNTVKNLKNGTAQGRSLKFKMYDPELDVLRLGDFYLHSPSRLGFDFFWYLLHRGAGNGLGDSRLGREPFSAYVN